MAQFSTTTAAAFIPEVWGKAVLLAREAKLVMGKRVKRYDVEMAGRGDILHVPNVANLSTNAVGSDGGVSGQAATETDQTFTITRWREATVDIPDIVSVQSQYDLFKIYTQKIGYALGLDVEDQLLALYTGFSQSVGTAGVDITDDVYLNAVQLLDDGDHPEEMRSFVGAPSQKRALMKIDKFVDASKAGLIGKKGPIITGLFGEIYGVPTFFSTRVVSSAGRRNMMFHQEGMALIIQKEVKVEKLARSRLADILAGHILFLAAELRDTADVQILS